MMTREKRNRAHSRARYELRRPLLAQIKVQAARITELEAQRDALLKACEAAYDAMLREDFGTVTLAPKLKAAIAKARGEAADEHKAR